MNDRLKFRAKLKNINNWVYGAYLKMLPYQPNPVGHRKPLETEYKHLIITEGSADWGMPREIAAYEVIPETVGQCTGLKDKNGKLIYEGDIVKYAEFDWTDFSFNDWETEIAQVVWGNTYDNYYPAFDLKDTDFDGTNAFAYLFNEGWTIEAIGNIYENKELLEEYKDE